MNAEEKQNYTDHVVPRCNTEYLRQMLLDHKRGNSYCYILQVTSNGGQPKIQYRSKSISNRPDNRNHKFGYLLKVGFSNRRRGVVDRIVERSNADQPSGFARLIGLLSGVDLAAESHMINALAQSIEYPDLSGVKPNWFRDTRWPKTTEWFVYNEDNVKLACLAMYAAFDNVRRQKQADSYSGPAEQKLFFTGDPSNIRASDAMWFSNASKIKDRHEPGAIKRLPLIYFNLARHDPPRSLEKATLLPNQPARNKWKISSGIWIYAYDHSTKKEHWGLLTYTRVAKNDLYYRAEWDPRDGGNNFDNSQTYVNQINDWNVPSHFRIYKPSLLFVQRRFAYPGFKLDGNINNEGLQRNALVAQRLLYEQPESQNMDDDGDDYDDDGDDGDDGDVAREENDERDKLSLPDLLDDIAGSNPDRKQRPMLQSDPRVREFLRRIEEEEDDDDRTTLGSYSQQLEGDDEDGGESDSSEDLLANYHCPFCDQVIINNVDNAVAVSKTGDGRPPFAHVRCILSKGGASRGNCAVCCKPVYNWQDRSSITKLNSVVQKKYTLYYHQFCYDSRSEDGRARDRGCCPECNKPVIKGEGNIGADQQGNYLHEECFKARARRLKNKRVKYGSEFFPEHSALRIGSLHRLFSAKLKM
tara:strand:- start:568 stop:2490 length:1923 start_codon:yes stop_codon:yes gene_type:complete